MCELGPRWHRALLDDDLADPVTRTLWALTGLWGDTDAGEVLRTAADEYDPHVAADAVLMAGRWPSVSGITPERARTLAERWREVGR